MSMSNGHASGSHHNKVKMVIDKPNQFPWKLYDMLETAERRGEEHVISWIRDGSAFKVHNREIFIEEYMKKQFNQTKYKSFQRQLNLWGFERVQSGPDKGSYYHPLFIKGQRECCQRLTRVRLKGAPSETKHANQGTDDALNQDAKMPAVINGGTAADVPMAAGIAASSTLGLPGAATTTGAPLAGISIATAIPPVHGFSSLEPPRISTIEATLRGGSQQQIADLIRYQQESQHREALAAAAAAGLGPDASSLLGSSMPFIPAIDRSSLVMNGLLQHQLEQAQKEQQQQTNGQTLEIKQAPQVQEQTQHPGQEPSQEGIVTSVQVAQPPTPTLDGQGQATAGASMTSRHDEMAALLAVSAQKRREEELAHLLELSKTKGVDV